MILVRSIIIITCLFAFLSLAKTHEAAIDLTQCVKTSGTFTATNWPSNNPTINIGCGGDHGPSGCVGGVDTGKLPGQGYEFTTCSCLSDAGAGCLKAGTDVTIRSTGTDVNGFNVIDGGALPPGCTIAYSAGTSQCATNSLPSLTNNIHITCPAAAPTPTQAPFTPVPPSVTPRPTTGPGTPTSTPAPTRVPVTPIPTSGSGVQCIDNVSASVSPESVKVGDRISFTLNRDASTYFEDSLQGVTDCSGSWTGSGGTKICTARTPGTYTWLHSWRRCEGANCSPVEARCQVTARYTITSNTCPVVENKPIGLKIEPAPVCDANKVTLRWDTVPNAGWYDIRVNGVPSGDPRNNCSGHSVCINRYTGGNSIEISVTPGQSFTWWVHAGGDGGSQLCSQTNKSDDSTFTVPRCGVTPPPLPTLTLTPTPAVTLRPTLTLTPTVTPIPTRIPTPTLPPFSPALCKCDGIEASGIFPGANVSFSAFAKVFGTDTTRATVKDITFSVYESPQNQLNNGVLLARSGPISAQVISQAPAAIRSKSTWNYTFPANVNKTSLYRVIAQINCVRKVAVGPQNVLAATDQPGWLQSIFNAFGRLFDLDGSSQAPAPAAPTSAPTATQAPSQRNNLQLQTLKPAEELEKSCTLIKFRFNNL